MQQPLGRLLIRFLFSYNFSATFHLGMSASTFLASDTNAANPSVSTCNFCGIAATAVEASSFALVVKAKCEACFSDRKDEWGFKCLATIDATKPQEANDGMVLYNSATTPPK